MTRIVTILSLLLLSSTSFANCPNDRIDELTRQSKQEANQSNRYYETADYLYAKLNDRNGPYYNNQAIAMLMMETRTLALRYSNQSARLQIEASKLLIDCMKK